MGLIVAGMAAITLQLMVSLGRPEVFSAERFHLVVIPQWLPRPLDIFRADLQGQWLAGVNLRDADAILANLQGADLRGVDLQDANLRGADLQDASLRGADLQKIKGLTNEQVQSARTAENTALVIIFVTYVAG
jgi:hypothetical protein